MNDVTKPASVDYDDLKYHDLSQIFPLIEGDEFEGFVEGFKKHGLLQQIVLHEGKILEGRNRYRAGKKLGYKFSAKDFTELPSGKNPYEFVLVANVQRRHLTTEQKRTLGLRLIRERPNDSDRKIALLLGMSNKTISTYRKELEEMFERFIRTWHDLDANQRRDFVSQYRHEIAQAGGV
jgi:hypothetical protein